MPNWCDNSTTIKFNSLIVANDFETWIKKVAKGTELDEHGNDLALFSFFIPEPQHSKEDDGILPAWYQWRLDNWGCKWDANLHHHEWIDDNTVILHYSTPWGPPDVFLHAVVNADEGNEVYNSYFEPGMGFCGTFSNGDEEHYDYSSFEDPDDVRAFVGADLDDEWGISEMIKEWIEENEEYDSTDSGVESFG